MTGELDPLDFIIARDLGIPDVAALPHALYVRWRAFYVYEHAMKDLAAGGA